MPSREGATDQPPPGTGTKPAGESQVSPEGAGEGKGNGQSADSSKSSSPAALSPAGSRRATALSLFYKAKRQERGENPEGALATYQECLGLVPGASQGGSPRLDGEIIHVLTRLGRLDEALVLREKSVKQFPSLPGPLLALSEFLDAQAAHNPRWKVRSREAAQRAVDRFPDSAAALHHLVRLRLADQERAKAQAAVRKALKSSPSKAPGFWLSLATAARNAFPLDDAATREANFAIVSQPVERALRLAPGEAGLLVAAGDFYARARRADKALPLYERAAALSPGDLKARQKLGQCLRMAGREEEAIRVFEALTAIDSGDLVSHEALRSLYETSDPVKALEHRAEVLRLDNGDPRDYTAAAEELLKLDRATEALTLLKRGVFFNPQSAPLYYHLSRAQERRGEFTAALQSLSEAEGLAKTKTPRLLDSAFYYSWAGVASKAGKEEEAGTRYRQSIEAAPREKPELGAPAYHDLGFLWLRQNKNLEAAGELLRTANDLVPDQALYLSSLGWFHLIRKDYPAALTCLRRAVELSRPNPSPELLEHLAQAEKAAAASGLDTGGGAGSASEKKDGKALPDTSR